MRLLRVQNNGDVSLTRNYVKNIPKYAILSHTWGEEEEEVTLKDLLEGSGRAKAGYKKIVYCAKQASKDGLEYFWVDTCCIDKANNTELSEAINSMYNWYRNAAVCYVYLSDVSHFQNLDSSRWFTRGWTLQELLAPKHMEFFGKNWVRIDTRLNLIPTISRVTGIPRRLLMLDITGGYSVAQVLSWAAGRETTREEDMAYCLLGLLGVNMPLIYGEGPRAFERLQQEFIKTSTDHSIFAWTAETKSEGHLGERGAFGCSPMEFRSCTDLNVSESNSTDFSMTNRGLRIDLPLISAEDGTFLAVLDCCGEDNCRRAIYLKEVPQRPGVYRRVRCAEELCRIGPDQIIPPPKTLFIESAMERSITLGDRLFTGQQYVLLVEFTTTLTHGFHVEQHHILDAGSQWNLENSHNGSLILTVDSSGQYAGLQFTNKDLDQNFIVALGIHNYKGWLDITNAGAGEDFASVIEEYYHFRTAHDNRNHQCRCLAPWRFSSTVTRRLSHRMYVVASIGPGVNERSYLVDIQVKVDECGEKLAEKS